MHFYSNKLTKISTQGFTLIEVLVSMIILAVGLLGLMSVQILSLKNNSNADYRTLATISAYDMADKIRANRAAFDAGTFNNVSSSAGGTLCTSGCTPATLASSDIKQWQDDLDANLPEGLGTISVASPATDGLDITITWKEGDGEAVQDKTFIYRVRL